MRFFQLSRVPWVALWLPIFLTVFVLFLTPYSPRPIASKLTSFACQPRASTQECHPKPNLIMTALTGPEMLEHIIPFLASIEAARGRAMLIAQAEHRCLPAEVHVKMLTPLAFAENLPDNFKGFLRRYKNLEFVGALRGDLPIVYDRFIGWSTLVNETGSSYSNVIVCDLDIVFQREPFSIPLDGGVELLVFHEWRGLAIGQDWPNHGWLNDCRTTSKGPYVTEEQFTSYQSLTIICAGATYGTSRAMAVYLNLMATELQDTNFECNDQGLHIHLYYSGKLQAALTAGSAGRVKVMQENETLFGSVGTAPLIRFNEWGEMLNDRGDVQVAVHQFKTHPRLKALVQRKYGWQPLLDSPAISSPVLAVDAEWSQSDPRNIPRYRLSDVSPETCRSDTALCSCRWHNCQFGNYHDEL